MAVQESGDKVNFLRKLVMERLTAAMASIVHVLRVFLKGLLTELMVSCRALSRQPILMVLNFITGKPRKTGGCKRSC